MSSTKCVFWGENNACCSLRHFHIIITANTTDMSDDFAPAGSTTEMVPLQESSAPPIYPVLKLENKTAYSTFDALTPTIDGTCIMVDDKMTSVGLNKL